MSRAIVRVARRVLQPFLSVGDLDLRVTGWRLDALRARHAEISAIVSLDDSPGAPNGRLIDLATALLPRAKAATLPLLVERGAPPLVHLWPGEHYRLLAGVVQEVEPETIVEIGTYTGLSALAMLPMLERGARLVSVDVVPWHRLPNTYLKQSDFADGRFCQLVCDLGEPQTARAHAALLREADLVFVDAAKDGVLERKLLTNFAAIGLKPGALIIFDDIRVWRMLDIWREIAHPKLDATSFGAWSGTGLVDWAGAASSCAGAGVLRAHWC